MNRRYWKRLCLLFMGMSIIVCGCENPSVEIVQEEVDMTSQESPESEVDMTSQELPVSEVDVTSQELPASDVDIDLTKWSSTMVYSEVYNMMVMPADYIGKIVKMKGTFTVAENPETGQLYFACIISDAAACCAQGIEFELEGEYTYPDDYPDVSEEITVTGTFETYEEDGYTYCRLQNASME